MNKGPGELESGKYCARGCRIGLRAKGGCTVYRIKTVLREGLLEKVRLEWRQRLGGGEGAKLRNLGGGPSRERDQLVQRAWAGACLLCPSETWEGGVAVAVGDDK